MSPSDRREFLIGAGSAAVLALASEIDLLAALPRLAAPIEVAVIGCGRQGRALLSELAKFPEVKLAALCDPLESRLASAERRAAGAARHTSYKDLLDKHASVSALFVATPTHRHREICVDALSAGKHIYCESPLASTGDDARAIATAARSAKTLFQTGMQARSNPIYKLALSFHRSGALRGLASLRAHNHKKTSWRFQPGAGEDDKSANWRLDPEVSLGLEGELGVQQLDVFHWFLGEYPSSVRGSGSIRLHDDGRKLPDTVALDFGFQSGLRLAYSATLANSYEGVHEILAGEMATLRLAWNAGWMFKEADAPTQGWEVYANRQQFHDEQGITLIADATKLAAQQKLKEGVGLPEPPLYYPVADFLKSATEGKPVACSAEEGLRAALVGIAAHAAVSTGTEQKLDPALFKS